MNGIELVLFREAESMKEHLKVKLTFESIVQRFKGGGIPEAIADSIFPLPISQFPSGSKLTGSSCSFFLSMLYLPCSKRHGKINLDPPNRERQVTGRPGKVPEG